MNIRHAFLASLAAAALLAGCGTHSRSACAPLGAAAKAKLADYVQKKYKVPAGVPLDVTEVSRVGSSCYDKLVFQAPRDLSSFRVELIASPDYRFLSREVMDSQVDPIAEERQKRRTITTGLTDGDFPTMGPGNAPVTLAVFSDFQCPWCARLAGMLKNDVLPAVSGHVRVVYRYMPLSMHDWARPAAEAAGCARQQGDVNFWKIHDFLFDHQKELTAGNLRQRLTEQTRTFPGFDGTKFQSCISERSTAGTIDADLAFAARNGVRKTPTVFLNGQQVNVVAPEQLATLIGQLIRDPGAAVPQATVTDAAPDSAIRQACARPDRARAVAPAR
jgi:protein-disulfide isomerase